MSEKKKREKKKRPSKEQPQCPSCGYGFYSDGKGGVVPVPHDMDCPELKKIADIERSGVCHQCGAKKTIESGWDNRMQLVVTVEACPNGHSHGMKCAPPTKADIVRFGLREVRR